MKKMEATAELKKESEEEVVVVNGGSSSSSAPNTTSSSSFGKLPRRLQRRLVEESQKRSIQQIQSKLQEAHLRRQQFHELLSTKAQLLSSKVLSKPRSTELLLSPDEEDIGRQLLDAEPNAAEQKRCWREFMKLKKTTFALTKAYLDLDINGNSVKLMPFEQLCHQIESAATIQTAKALLEQLETWITCKQAATDTRSSLQNIDHLLKSIAAARQMDNNTNSTRSREVKLSRYPVRVVLCAYMIMGHVDAICSGKGECKIALTESAETFVREFELLIQIVLLDGSIQTPQEESASAQTRLNFESQMKAFDEAWCSYLYRFVSWKVKDATALDKELVKAACQLELSMIQTCNQTSEGDYGDLKLDMKAIIGKQVIKDQKLLKEIVQHSSGYAGIERIESALSDIRSRFAVAKEAGSSLASPRTRISSPNSPGSSYGSAISVSRGNNDLAEGNRRLEEDKVHTLREGANISADKMREMVEKVFWDGIMESMKQDEANNSWVL